MRYPFALALALLFSGCASDLSPEDRDFFYKGWTHPEQAANERMYGRRHVVDDSQSALPNPGPAN